MLSNNISGAYSFTTIRHLIDPERNIDIPIGIALCNVDRQQLHFRLPQIDERIPNLSDVNANASLQLAKTKIEHWLQSGSLPYSENVLPPLSETWWEHVRKLMQFRVRIGTVQPIDCQQPEEEIETLFDAVVKPQVRRHSRASRVNGAVTTALGDRLAARLPTRKSAPGYNNREVPVLRMASDAKRVLIVDAVNLAATTAEEETYALSSKIRSIRHNNEASDRETLFVVGYLASPTGLNGEGSLKEWFEFDTQARMYDLTREADEFRDRVRDAVDLSLCLTLSLMCATNFSSCRTSL